MKKILYLPAKFTVQLLTKRLYNLKHKKLINLIEPPIMQKRNSKVEFGYIAKFFHWFSAFAITLLLVLGFFMSDIPKASLWHAIAKNLHQLFGIAFLITTLIRIIWAAVNIQPQIPGKPSKFERMAAKFGHISLYVLMLALPLSGWLITSAKGVAKKLPTIGNYHLAIPGISKNFNLSKNVHLIHEILAWVIIIFIVLHIAAALKHHYINKNFVLRRMLPNRNNKMIIKKL